MPKKLVLDCDNELWAEVTAYKINMNLKSNNTAVIALVRLGLGVRSITVNKITTPEIPHGV